MTPIYVGQNLKPYWTLTSSPIELSYLCDFLSWSYEDGLNYLKMNYDSSKDRFAKLCDLYPEIKALLR